MVSLAPHDPPHFAPSAVPGRLLPLIRSGKKLIRYVAGLGSSTMAFTSRYTPGSNLRYFYAESFIHDALNRLGHPIGYVRDMDASASGGAGQYHFGAPGSTLAGMISSGLVARCVARCKAAAIASGGKVLVFAQAGNNDTGNQEAAATTLARVETMIQMVQAESAYIELVVMQQSPRLYNATGPDEAAVLPIRQAVNAGLVTLCATYGVQLLLCGSVGDDGSGYMLTTWADANRPGHWATIAADMVGKMAYDLMVARYRFPAPVDLLSLMGQAINLNPQLAGGSGTGDPTNWSYGLNTGGTLPSTTRLRIPYTDASGRNWERFGINANGGNGSVSNLNAYATGVCASGDVLEAFCAIRFPTAAGFAVSNTSISMFTQSTFVTAQASNIRVANQSPPLGIQYDPNVRILRSMPLELTATPTGICMQTFFTGTGDVDMSMPIIVKNRPSPDFS